MAVAVDLPFRQAAGVIEGVSAWAQAHRAAWRLLPMQPGFETRLVGLAESGGLDAAIGTFVSDSWIESLEALEVCTVNVFEMSQITSVPCVGVDERRIGIEAAQHLVEQGAKTFAYLGGGGLRSVRLRGEGFCAALAPSIPAATLQAGSLLVESLSALLASSREHPTGVFCANDSLAVELLGSARSLGMVVGEDLLVVGVGDDPAASIFAGVPLSTFEIPAKDVGWQAASLLAERLSTGKAYRYNPVPAPLLLPAKFLPRASSLASRPLRLVHRAADIVSARHADPALDATELARACGVSKRLLETTLRDHLNTSPARLIAAHRLDTARHLIEDTSLPFREVAERCGFLTQHHFSAWFRKQTGHSPRQFRQASKEV